MNMQIKKYQICNRCIMDTSDPLITFDHNGVCSHCTRYQKLSAEMLHSNNKEKLASLVATIKAAGKNKQYDCVIGVSGGVDSTYIAYTVKKLGLRPLAVHVDNGWNSELAVSNIEKTLKKLDIDLFTVVLDWEQFRDIQLAFLRASTPDSEIPTDHAILAGVYNVAAKFNIQYIIWGHNVVTEMIGSRAWSHGHMDWKYIYSVYKQFGNNKNIRSFPHFSIVRSMYLKLILHQKSISLLNYIGYDKQEATNILENILGWRPYGGKHYESVYTRFFQGYILPTKFGFDKRRAHLSTLINSGQITREAALSEIQKNPYPEGMLEDDKKFVIKKLGLTESEFDTIMRSQPRTFDDYPSYEKSWYYSIINFGYELFNKMTR